ncbi:general substrate transporter [Diplogelasinospora grovesii]|uniref:General substrate transporter n=1 Tax=Diplogelasinospora grovesii TaxID=303347 RepID=A0AAN6N7C3_9PEZI|nr:general substrate transporter [Diplogelasinospora grovesii]
MGSVIHHEKKERWFGLRGGWLTFWITFACSTDMTLFGYDQGVFSGVVISDDYLTVHGLQGTEHTNLLSIITSCYNLGCFLGAIVAFSVGERLGRKKTILVGTAVMSVGAALQTSSFSPAHMIVARIVSGIGNGINTSTAPVWQTETAQAKWRGKLVILEMMMNIFGFMTVNWINYGLSFAGGAVAWRLPLGLQFIFIVILFATIPWLPESPRWLIAHGRVEEAELIIADLENKPVDDPYVVAEKREIMFSVQYERENAVRWRDLLRGRAATGTKTMRRLMLGVGTQVMQQFGGINIMSYYMPTLLIKSVGLSDSMARLIAACSAVTYFVASGVATPLVERYGRRTMMLVSTAIQLFCFLLLTILLYFAQKPDYPYQHQVASASVVFFWLYYMGFGLGMLGIPWLYPTEINSLPMRTKGAATATAANWITNFLVVEVTPIGVQNLGWRFYIVWTVFNAVFIPIIWLVYPETADRTLEDLDAYYRENPPLFVTRDPDATSRRRPAKYIDMQQRDIAKASGRDVELAVGVEHKA